MATHFLRDFSRSSISKVNFSVLTKHWALILLSKFSEHYAIFEKKMDKIYMLILVSRDI